MRRIATLAGVIAASLTQVTIAADSADIGYIEISGTPLDGPGPYDWLLGTGDPTLPDLIQALDDAAFDDELDGLVIRLKDAALSLTQIEELAPSIERVRESGKRVHVFGESFGPTDLMFAALADEALIQSGGGVSMPGMFMEEIFLADTFEWLGVKADMIQVGAYKGANEMMTRSEPSPQWSETVDRMLDGLYANQRSILMGGRDLSESELDEAMRQVWLGTGDTAVKAGLLDAEVDLPALEDHLADAYGDDVAWHRDLLATDAVELDMSNPFALFAMLLEEPDTDVTVPSIAVIHVNGVIVDGDSTMGGLFGGQSVGSRTIRNALEKTLKEDLIKGVVVRINSPGGSATASEVMWQGIRRVAEQKPVWISVGSMAASGGYYLAVAGDRIYVNPSSIVGSIGVVGGKISTGGLYDLARVRVTERSRGPLAGMMSSTRPWDQTQRAFVRDQMTRTYDLFTRRVSAGRRKINLSETAEGRIFTGTDAVELEMADGTASLDDVLAEMADELDLDYFDVVDYPGPASLDSMLEDMLGGMVNAPMQGKIEMLKAVLGPSRFDAIKNGLEAMLLLRDHRTLLIMPRAIHIR